MHLQEPKKNGFTLIEILVSIVIIGILFGMGILNWNKTIQKQKIINVRNQIETALASGFSISRSQNKKVAIQGTNNSTFFCINHDGSCTSCDSKPENTLENGVSFKNGFCVTYTNPFGDIESDDNTISFASEDFQSSIDIDKNSGLITSNPVIEND